VVRWRAPRARWPRIVGRSRSPEATPRQGEGFSPSPCSAAGAAAECVPPPTAPTPRSGSRRRWVCRCASRARQGGTDLVVVPPQPSEQGAATDPALGAMNTMRGWGSLSDCAPAPAAGGRDSEHRARTNARVRKRSMRGIVLAASAASAGPRPRNARAGGGALRLRAYSRVEVQGPRLRRRIRASPWRRARSRRSSAPCRGRAPSGRRTASSSSRGRPPPPRSCRSAPAGRSGPG
jgi:hypothetical protein